jgi:mRNA interferase RelE/StbE
MKIAFNPNFVKDLKKLDKALQERVAEVIKGIEAADTLSDIPNVKKIKGNPHYFRIRIGNYRLGIYCESDEVELLRFLHRKDVYRNFP